jgi:hypothetical protein
MGLFKYVNFPVFLASFAFGLFAVYMTVSDQRKIYVYPTPENVDILLYKDKSDSCFSFVQEEVKCPKDESKISKIPVQY